MPNKLFQNQYRISSARAPWWDYRSSAPYFITIFTKHRENYFGEIENGIMHPNDLGKQAQKYWDEIPLHCSFVELINVVVMPNHMHGLVYLHSENADTIATAPGPAVAVQTSHATSFWGHGHGIGIIFWHGVVTDKLGLRDVACNVSTDKINISTPSSPQYE